MFSIQLNIILKKLKNLFSIELGNKSKKITSFMSGKSTTNKEENDELDLKNDENDYKNLINRLQDISENIDSLEKKYLDKL